jgi:hypothetical protein
MIPCPHCGSVSTRRVHDPETGKCKNEYGCLARVCRRRKEEDNKRWTDKKWVQCPATIGQTSITFCGLGEGHEGPHQRDSKVWRGDYTHPLAAALHARL